MKSDGFTLAETLAALLVLGMASSALMAASYPIGRLQDRTTQTLSSLSAARQIAASLERALAQGAPFSSARPGHFTGNHELASFVCGAGVPCKLAVEKEKSELSLTIGQKVHTLDLQENARLAYQGLVSQDDRWPPADQPTDTLRAINLVVGSGPEERVLFSAHVRIEQLADCAYDPVLKDCR